MKLIRSISTTLLLLIFTVTPLSAKKKTDYPRAEIKVEYNYHKKSLRGSDGVIERDIPFILLANSVQSKFYCPSTEFKDSLLSTPSGRAKEKEMFNAAVRAYSQNKDMSAMDGVSYKTFIYVIKDRVNAVSTVYDKAGLADYGYYSEPFSELEWSIMEDSTKTVMGYECIKAAADYHGRAWSVWFAPEIPVQDGPWKFCGLPGLILEACEPSGQHHFIATGIETSDKEITPVYSAKEHDRMARREMLKGYRNSIENSMAIFKARTGYDLGVKDAPVTEETRKYDFLETDYH